MSRINFAIVGGGWRAEFYLRIARALPEKFYITGMVVRNPEKGHIIEQDWGVRTHRNINDLLEAASPQFVVVSLPWEVAPLKTRELLDRGIPVLSETPPAPDLEGLSELYRNIKDSGTKYQVAEQYHLQPLHAARIEIAKSGLLGDISQVQISVCHGYHAISLIRRLMGLNFENAVIKAEKYITPIIEGPGREGITDNKNIVNSEQVIATLRFGDKLALYDFTDEQYFSWIRSLRLLLRGERGEIKDKNIKYLEDYRTPVDMNLQRLNAGEDGNLEGYFLKGIMAGNNWVYRNPFIPGRLTDDEIAIASCLKKMSDYLAGGPEFYGIAEAAQDHYLALMLEKAAQTGDIVTTENQIWVNS